ncbi:MAG TPA: xylulokinase [Anaerolineae bacterium]|nr:xylulokinase [Anaerolineae bacterium]HQH38685.1 xylulokinase [Anaerolineae bacterium]
MTKNLFLGIDISTTGAKALLMDATGAVVTTATTPLPLSTPKPLWSEQDPHDWWNGIVKSIRQALKQADATGDDVKAVGLTGQMHGLTLLDKDGAVLRPAILWNDQRTGAQCDEIRARVGKARFIQITGNDALTGFTAPKILWVRENEPEVYAHAAHILLPKDYVRYKLTGDYAADKADSAGTILFDIKARDWSAEVLEKLEIPREWLPRTYEGPAITGIVSAEAAALTGLKAGTPVVGGGGDQAAGAVGVGAVEPGIVGLVLGTSGVVFASTDAPYIEKNGLLHAFCHAVPGAWHLMGVMLSAAGSLQWHRDTLAPGISFDDLLVPAADVPAGAEGLFFLPYLTGERTPYPDPLARAGYIGLTLRHALPHMTRAVLEGVAFGLRDSMELVKGAGLGEIKQIRVSGGGAKSALWRQILADVIGSELVTVNTTEGGAYGAALLAAVGAGVWATVPEACRATIRVVNATSPQPEQVKVYDGLYPLYRGLYPALKPTFDAVA